MSSNQVQTHINVQVTDRNRKTAFFRWILIFPASLFLYAFTSNVHFGPYATGLLVLPAGLALLFRGVYPSYVLTFNHAVLELNTRITAYALLLVDDYPSIERNPNIAVILPDVEGGAKLSRGLPLAKWIFAIPLVVVGLFYTFVSAVLTLFAWLHVSLTGTYPGVALNIVVGTVQYWNRVVGYALLLVTDEYPTFRLSAQA